jgi:hypothetical protein
MTFEQAVRASRHGNVFRYRGNALLIASGPKKIAFEYSESADKFGFTDLTEEEKKAFDWQPFTLRVSEELESDVPDLCHKCAVNPATNRCCSCGKFYCDACVSGVHQDGPNLCVPDEPLPPK